jgi:hypothetical protein
VKTLKSQRLRWVGHMAGMKEARNAYRILRSSVNREITSRGIIGD